MIFSEHWRIWWWYGCSINLEDNYFPEENDLCTLIEYLQNCWQCNNCLLYSLGWQGLSHWQKQRKRHWSQQVEENKHRFVQVTILICRIFQGFSWSEPGCVWGGRGKQSSAQGQYNLITTNGNWKLISCRRPTLITGSSPRQSPSSRWSWIPRLLWESSSLDLALVQSWTCSF